MKVSVRNMNSSVFHLVRTVADENTLEQASNVVCEASLDIKQAFIDFSSAKDKCRPYLFLSGYVNSINGEFPRHIDEVVYDDPTDKQRVDYLYKFSNEEIAHLANLGMYDKGFQIPKAIYSDDFRLPIVCDYACVTDSEIPILFVNITHAYNNEIDGITSGYAFDNEEDGKCIGLAHYFEPIDKAIASEFVEPVTYESENVLSADDDMIDDNYEESMDEHDAYDMSDESDDDYVPTEEDMILQQAFENIQNRTENHYNHYTENEFDASVTDDIEVQISSNDELFESDDVHDDVVGVSDETVELPVDEINRQVDNMSEAVDNTDDDIPSVEEPDIEDDRNDDVFNSESGDIIGTLSVESDGMVVDDDDIKDNKTDALSVEHENDTVEDEDDEILPTAFDAHGKSYYPIQTDNRVKRTLSPSIEDVYNNARKKTLNNPEIDK